MIATIVDTEVLGKLAAASLLAGIGITAVFGVVIYTGTRFADLRREGNSLGAAAFAVLTTLALLAFAAGVVYGIVVMTRK